MGNDLVFVGKNRHDTNPTCLEPGGRDCTCQKQQKQASNRSPVTTAFTHALPDSSSKATNPPERFDTFCLTRLGNQRLRPDFGSDSARGDCPYYTAGVLTPAWGDFYRTTTAYQVLLRRPFGLPLSRAWFGSGAHLTF